MPNPENLKFTKSHEWISEDGTVGISDHAQKEITDVVFVDLPTVGKELKAGEAAAVVESVKAAFDIYAPISGKIKEANQAVSDDPAVVNQSAYENGWLFKIDMANPAERDSLMSHDEYQEFLKTASHS